MPWQDPEILKCGGQGVGKDLNLQGDCPQRDGEAKATVTQCRHVPLAETKALPIWHPPQGTCLQETFLSCPRRLLWKPGPRHLLLPRVPAPTALPGADSRSLTTEMPALSPGETGSCLTAMWQDNLWQEIKMDSHH